ncbi:MAG: methyltransferase [Myxococcota bacterium]
MVSEADPATSTRDTLWGGDLVFWQPARGAGYRFNLDPVLLSGFVRPAARILDLGSGCGILPVLLLAQNKAQRVHGVEVQAQLAAFAALNAAENGFSERIIAQQGDLRSVALPTVDTVVFNPPYFRVGEGRSAPDPGREIARRERHGTLEDFVRRGLDALNDGGALCCIVRIDREDELVSHVHSHGGRVLRLRQVRSRDEAEPRHVMLEARRAATGCCREEPPLVVHDGDGYSAEVRALLRQ